MRKEKKNIEKLSNETTSATEETEETEALNEGSVIFQNLI